MGCDIHVHRETRNAEGTWESTDNWSLPPPDGDKTPVPFVDYSDQSFRGRDYGVFGILTNGQVRYGIVAPYLIDPRGIPEDCDARIKVQFEEWGSDAHSASYLTMAELKAMQSELGKHIVLGLSNCIPVVFTHFKEYVATLDIDGGEDCRIVFWFDN